MAIASFVGAALNPSGLALWTYPLETRAVEDSRALGRFSLMFRLRSSVPIESFDHSLIHTVRGAGYCLRG